MNINNNKTHKMKQYKNAIDQMKMFKVMMAASWKDRNGNVRPYVKYMKSETIEEVIKHLGTNNIFLVEEC